MKPARKHRVLMLCLAVLSCVVAFANTGLPLVFERIIDALAASDGAWLKNLGFYLGIILVIIAAELGRKLLSTAFRTGLLGHFRSRVTAYLLGAGYSEFSTMSPQEYLSVINNDLPAVVDDYYDNINQIIFQIVSIAISTTALSFIYAPLAIIAVLSSVIITVIPFLFARSLGARKEQMLSSMAKYNVRMGDVIFGYAEIKINLMKNAVRAIAERSSSANRKKMSRYENLASLSEIVIAFVSFGSSFLILLFGGIQVARSSMSIGELTAAFQLSEALVTPILGIAYSMNTAISMRRTMKNLSEKFAPQPEDAGIRPTDSLSSISYNNIGVKYGDETVLGRFNYTFEKGKKYLILGSNGSGKSTLIRMLVHGMELPNAEVSGSILLNDTDRREYSDEYLFSHVAVVQQSPYLFSASTKENITCFRGGELPSGVTETLDRLNAGTLKKAIAEDRILSDDSDALSGGERQKLALLRALMSRPEWMILDESTSAMDAQSREFVEDMLLADPNLTVLHVAHGVSEQTKTKYDRVVEL